MKILRGKKIATDAVTNNNGWDDAKQTKQTDTEREREEEKHVFFLFCFRICLLMKTLPPELSP